MRLCWIQGLVIAGTVALSPAFAGAAPADQAAAAPAASQLNDALTAYNHGDYPTAYRLWLPLAERGNAHAQNNIGFMYAQGQGMAQDYTAALGWYSKAADQGIADAQEFLGLMYQYGQGGVAQDYAAALSWYRKAADQGNAQAQEGIREVEQRSSVPTPNPTRVASPLTIPTPTVKSLIEDALVQRDNCLSSARSSAQLSALAKHLPNSPGDVTLAQLADPTAPSKTALPLIAQYEELTRACDAAAFSALNDKAPAIVAALKLEWSQEQDAWVELIQRKFKWGGLNQRLKAIYADGDSKVASEKERLLLAEQKSIDAAAQANAQAAQAQREAIALAQQRAELQAQQAAQDAYMARMAAAAEATARAAACATARQKTANDNQVAQNTDVGTGAIGVLGVIARGAEAYNDSKNERAACQR